MRDILLTNEVARTLGVAPDTVRLWERRGLLPAAKTAAGVRLFSKADVEAFARSRKASADLAVERDGA
jgi:excisionase family DNA binding protein